MLGLLQIKCKVPQGSILRPLLLLICIDDFFHVSEYLSSIADSTNLFYSQTGKDFTIV